jgi:hypothetical protein
MKQRHLKSTDTESECVWINWIRIDLDYPEQAEKRLECFSKDRVDNFYKSPITYRKYSVFKKNQFVIWWHCNE